MEIYEILQSPTKIPSIKKKNVCAYARVSSNKDISQMSFELQISSYTEYITKNPEWNFKGVFADEGKSGTNTEKRTQFQLMMDLAKTGSIDLILTKSLSRFARNVVDCLDAIRLLKSYGTEVFFETDNISSFDPKIEFVISVLSGIAEEESRNVSENMKWSVKRRFEQGLGNVVTKRLLGYDKDDNGNLIINQYQAEIVRLIYRKYIFGSSVTEIIEELESRGIKTVNGNDKWAKSSIMYILKNDIYTGSLTLQKTYRPDYHSKNKVINKGEKTRYEVDESHPAIITRADYEHVQVIMQSRNSWRNESTLPTTNRSKYKGIFRCSKCGKNYRMKWNNRNKASASQILVCASNVDSRKCENEAIFASVADDVINKVISLIKSNQTEFLDTYSKQYKYSQNYIEDTKSYEDIQRSIAKIKEEIETLKTKNDSIAHKLLVEFEARATKLEIDRVALENKFCTIHNTENRIKQIQLVLKKKSIEFKELFDHIDVKNLENWKFQIFCLAPTNLVGGISILSGEHEYYNRKSKRKVKFEVII